MCLLLTRGASFVLPKSIPPNSASESLIKADTSGMSTSPAPYSSIRSRTRQPSDRGMSSPDTAMALRSGKSSSSSLPYACTAATNSTTISAVSSQRIMWWAVLP